MDVGKIAGNITLPLALTALCLALTLGSAFWGASAISPFDIWPPGRPEAEIFWRLRLPRATAAFFVGAGLAMSGMAFQALFRNPLATPFTLGVSSGAAFGASAYFGLGAGLSFLGSSGSLVAALAGGLLSMSLVYGITRARGGFSTPVMLLAGVVISFFFSSLTTLIQYLSGAQDSLRIMHWLLGSFAGLESSRLADLAFVVTAGALILYRLAPETDLLCAGEELAASRGMRVTRGKLLLFAVSSVMVGTAVSLAGPIGFVGMMLPHICRMYTGWNHRRLLPAVFAAGGCFVALADLFSRVILAPAEMPVGIITALIGGPFFLWVLFRSQRGGEMF
ncbi:MAG: iron ABC transporter permease [Deltaproteobacteria bacterium]|jgi:iron complex transport system permease protein|nr:iron ABC transporter permease [Deltaproteobacteria bacterium]